MKGLKKFTAEFLTLILTISTFAVGITAFSDTEYKTGDVIEFGSYPQTEIEDEEIISALNNSVSEDDFTSFGYYSGKGEKGTESSGDFMLYTDTVYQGIKYRGIIINEKRPLYTYKATGTYKPSQKNFDIGTKYWFRYDPIEWIILDADEGLVISKASLDAQPFNNSSLTSDADGYNSYYSSSSLRNFINNQFIETAFNGESDIFSKVRDDAVFIPTKDDILNTAYGFSTDSETVTSSAYSLVTDYDIANGAISQNIEEGIVVPYWIDSVFDKINEKSVYFSQTIQNTEVYMTLGVRVAAYVDIENVADSYTLSYFSDGKCIENVTLHEGDAIADYIPSKDHYTFTGWDYAVPDTMPGYDLTFNANWQINSNELTINANEGTFSDGSNSKKYTVNYGESLSDYIERPSRQGYIFSGWDITIPAEMPDETLSLNAVWTEAEDTPYIINIYKEKATGDNNGEKEYDIEVINKTGKTNSIAAYEPKELSFFDLDTDKSNLSEIIKPDGTTELNVYYTRKTGIVTFSFGAGYQSINQQYKYGQKITFPEIPEREGYAGKWDKVTDTYDGTVSRFTVIWNAGEYSISFDTDGGSNIDNITAECDSPVTAPENPVKEGYSFISWDKEFPETMPAGGLNLKAIWEKNTYTINYVVNGTSTQVTVPYGDEIPEQAIPQSEGYTFREWSPVLPDTMPSKDLTVYAVFDRNEYTITWNYNGNTEYTKIKYGESITPIKNPEKTGYTFISWDKEIPALMPAMNLEFNAVFEICSYKITFKSNDEIVAEYTLNYGEQVKAPAAAEITGYTFTGWSNLPETMPASDVVSTAVYSKNTYTLTYNYGDKTQTYEVGYHDLLPTPGDIEITGYKFVGWNDSVPKSMPANNLTFTAIYEEIPFVAISGYRSRTEKYKTTITFHANYSHCSADEIYWYDGNGNIVGNGESITISQAKNSYTIQAKVLRNGNTVASSEAENVKIKNGFFDKIISFFGRLFVPSRYKIDQR